MNKINAVIGSPVAHSKSPSLHNWLYETTGLQKEFYFTGFEIEPSKFKAAILGLKILGVNGLAVTTPYKEKILKCLDKIQDEASSISSINTVLNFNGQWHGYNTDWLGGIIPILIKLNSNFRDKYKLFCGKNLVSFFKNSFKSKTITKSRVVTLLENLPTKNLLKNSLSNEEILILGAGGASKAFAYGLLYSGAKITLANRTLEKAKKISKQMQSLGFPQIQTLSLNHLTSIKQYKVIINATSSSLNGDFNLVNGLSFSSDQILFETGYHPIETSFLKAGEKNKSQKIYGLEMLFWQALYQFKIHTQTRTRHK